MQCQVLSYFLLAVLTSSWCSFFPPSPYQVLISSIRRGTVWRLSFPACPPAAFCLCLKCFICVSPKVETVTELAHTPTWFGTAIRSLILSVIAGRALKNDCKWLFPPCWIWKEHFNDFKQKKNNCAYLTFYNIHCSCTYSHGSHKNINIDSSYWKNVLYFTHLWQEGEVLKQIEREVRMREGASKLLAACSRREQALEASRSLLTCSARILALLSQLQRMRKAQILGRVGRRSDGVQGYTVWKKTVNRSFDSGDGDEEMLLDQVDGVMPRIDHQREAKRAFSILWGVFC